MEQVTKKQLMKLNLGTAPDYVADRVKAAEDLAASISPYVACEPVFNVSKNDKENKWYMERNETPTVRLIGQPVEVEIYTGWQGKKYTVSSRSIHSFSHAKYSGNSRSWKGELEEPNQIGVMTKKKITDWINYYAEICKRLKVIHDKNVEAEKQFRDAIKDMPVRWYNDGKQGYIEKNGLEFEFTIEPEYIRTEIKVRAVSTLQNFVLMTHGQYVKER